jgi:hypothetical protein
MKVTVMTADEQFINLDVEPDESVSPLPSPVSIFSCCPWSFSPELVMNLQGESGGIGNLGFRKARVNLGGAQFGPCSAISRVSVYALAGSFLADSGGLSRFGISARKIS